MEKLHIKGGTPLQGEVKISGAKNSVLPMLTATLLTDEQMVIRNVPHLHDVTTINTLLGQMGVSVVMTDQFDLHVQSDDIKSLFVPYDIVRTMRASILVLGPMVARYGEAVVSLPGGCAIGTRPVNIHLDGLRQMGATVTIEDGYIKATTHGKRLRGAHIVLSHVTVTGTENLLMAAVLAEGETIIENAAHEPEVVDLANCLVAMGGKITGQGTSTITVLGCRRLKGCTYSVLPDRIEAGTFLVAAATTGGHIRLNKINPNLLDAVLQKLEQVGAEIQVGENFIELKMAKRAQATDIETDPYPAFPTDMQAQFTSLNSIAQGSAVVTEKIFDNRFMHVLELQRMGADIQVKGNTVIVRGVDQLMGTSVMATDLRASASLIIAGLAAKGETMVDRIYHIDRGYECIEEKLKKLGANIQRIYS